MKKSERQIFFSNFVLSDWRVLCGDSLHFKPRLHDTTGLTNTVWQPVECLYTRYSRLFDNRFDNRAARTAVRSTRLLNRVVQLVCQRVWQPVVSCKRGLTLEHGAILSTHFRCGSGRICNNHFTTNLLVKEFWKSVKICRTYSHEFGVFLFGTVYISTARRYGSLTLARSNGDCSFNRRLNGASVCVWTLVRCVVTVSSAATFSYYHEHNFRCFVVYSTGLCFGVTALPSKTMKLFGNDKTLYFWW